jgi:HK97 family phage prohead protease
MAGDSGIPGHLPHQLAAWWEHGPGAAKIRWGEGGDFDRCVRLAVEEAHMDPERAKGFCAERHHAVLGIWPATHAKMEGKSAMSYGEPRFNPNHVPSGAGGGQFTSGGGGGGKKAAPKAAATAKKPLDAHQQHLAHMQYLAAHPVKEGESGQRVSDLQQMLNKLGASLKADGIFGPKTLAAVEAFQRSHKDASGKPLKVDGLVGPLTMAALEAAHAPAKQKATGHVGPALHGTAKQKGRSVMPLGDDRASKPYGDVAYADPKNGKYPIDTAAHAKAAWSYISMPKNAAQYPMNGVTLAEVKDRIMAACKKFGITVADTDGDMNAAHFAPDVDVVRSGEGITLEPADDGSLGTLTGRFSEFGRWYPVSSRLEGNFLERAQPGATLDTIRDDVPSMRVLFDHGMDGQVGNKVLGPIRSLEERSDGPWYEVPLFDTSSNRDLLPGLKAGVYGASMRMRVLDDAWDDKPARSEHNPDGIPERTITRMKVLEFGPVTFPANPGASAGVRSQTDEFYARLAKVDAPAFADAARSAGLSLEDFTGLVTARSGPGREQDVQPGHGRTSPTTMAALRDRAWRMREVR